MTIYRERRPIHPGEILAEDVLAEQWPSSGRADDRRGDPQDGSAERIDDVLMGHIPPPRDRRCGAGGSFDCAQDDGVFCVLGDCRGRRYCLPFSVAGMCTTMPRLAHSSATKACGTAWRMCPWCPWVVSAMNSALRM